MRAEWRPTQGERERIWVHYLHEHDQFNARLNLFLVAEAMLVVAAAQVLTAMGRSRSWGSGYPSRGSGLRSFGPT